MSNLKALMQRRPRDDARTGMAGKDIGAMMSESEMCANMAKSLERKRAEIETLQARVKELEDVLDQRDGGAHDQDCRVFRQPPRPCNCGHELARTTLRADQ